MHSELPTSQNKGRETVLLVDVSDETEQRGSASESPTPNTRESWSWEGGAQVTLTLACFRH